MLRDDEVEEVLDWIERHCGPQLTDWEFRFIEDVRRRWDRDGSLSPGTLAKLDEIFEQRREK